MVSPKAGICSTPFRIGMNPTTGNGSGVPHGRANATLSFTLLHPLCCTRVQELPAFGLVALGGLAMVAKALSALAGPATCYHHHCYYN